MGMGSKNISIAEDAYARLRRARKHPGESFSEVIRRGKWDTVAPTAQAWLSNMECAPSVDESVLEALEFDQQNDTAPKDKWTC
jgi:hypothetical protein